MTEKSDEHKKKIGIGIKRFYEKLSEEEIDNRHNKRHKLYPDLTGKKFAMLTVLSFYGYTEYKGGKARAWNCSCDCGGKVTVITESLNNGSNKSCGCLSRGPKPDISMVGKKYGKLFVKERLQNNGYAGNYLCECDCGEIVTKTKRSITKSLQCIKCSDSDRTKFTGSIPSFFFSKLKWTALKRGLEFLVSIEYLSELYIKQNSKCCLSGRDIFFPKTARKRIENKASLDRIDSSKGYIEGNVQWLHADVNIMKLDMSQDDFIKLCKEITECQNILLK